jgi:hypothetical protein
MDDVPKAAALVHVSVVLALLLLAGSYRQSAEPNTAGQNDLNALIPPRGPWKGGWAVRSNGWGIRGCGPE